MRSIALRNDCSIDRILSVFEKRPGCVFLDSGSHEYGLGRYSILASDPFKELVFGEGRAEIREGEKRQSIEGNPFDLLREQLDESVVGYDGQFPFSGGAIGYVAYDIGQIGNGVSKKRPGPEMRFGFYDGALVWDHELGTLQAVTYSHFQNCVETLQRLQALVDSASEAEIEGSFQLGDVSSNFSREAYLQRVRKTREYIKAGEIYQANLSQRFRASFQGSGASLYRRLRRFNPAPYAAYLKFGDEEILSSSPERFFLLQDGSIDTRPIKGTRPRGTSEIEDEAFRRDLAQSEKDKAELLMIVDLERNDLGRICQAGSIRVKSPRPH